MDISPRWFGMSIIYNGWIWVFPKIGVFPQIIHFNRVFHYKLSILGYPYFWKPPHIAPELKAIPKGNDRIPTIHFQGWTVSFWGCNSVTCPLKRDDFNRKHIRTNHWFSAKWFLEFGWKLGQLANLFSRKFDKFELLFHGQNGWVSWWKWTL